MKSVRLQGKPFNITVIQDYVPTSNAEEAEVEWFCEDLQDLLELTPKKHGCYILTTALPDLERGIVPLCHPVSTQPKLLGGS